jgi:hypothetical protein
MSSRAFATVLKSFMGEAERIFGFLASEFGLAGPERRDVVLPVVTFTGPGVRYRIMLEPDDKVAFVQVVVDEEDGTLVASLSELVLAAKLGTRQQIRAGAHNLNNLQKALENQASFVRRIHPLMNTGTTIELMQKANARKWHTK